MILVDLNQVMISNLFANIGFQGKSAETPDVNEDLIRHMVLNSLRFYKMKFQVKYGSLVICCDNKHYWRRDVFPHYKAGRRKERERSPLDWHLVFDTLNKLRDEIATFFPYRVLNVHRAEADDIIGVIAKREHTAERVLVLSGDKDFAQLQKYPNIDQFAPIQKKFIKPDNAIETLREHIMLGDNGDGIPNFLSPDDTFVTGKRQTPIRKDKLERWVKAARPEDFCDIKMLRGYKRNQNLIDLDFIPRDIQQTIVDEWEKPFEPSRKHLLDYFVKNKLVQLMDHIGEF